jgi:hypothetical protein
MSALRKIATGETVSNLFHGATALAFGLVTLSAALHVVMAAV